MVCFVIYFGPIQLIVKVVIKMMSLNQIVKEDVRLCMEQMLLQSS